MTNKKQQLNRNQIIKYANKMSLVDAVDSLTTKHQKTGEFNKKIIININNFGDKSHKERGVAFFWSMEDALIVANDIVNGHFQNITYDYKGKPGVMTQYGGGQVSRIMTIAYSPQKGAYLFQIALYKAKKGANGSVVPDKSSPIDTHAIQIPMQEMRKFMMALKNRIQAQSVVMLMGNVNTQEEPTNAQNEVNMGGYEAPQEPVEEITNEEVDDINDFLNNL